MDTYGLHTGIMDQTVDQTASPVDLAASKVGGKAALARLLGITRAAVNKWDQIPLRRVPDVERFTGIDRKKLRPDYFS